MAFVPESEAKPQEQNCQCQTTEITKIVDIKREAKNWDPDIENIFGSKVEELLMEMLGFLDVLDLIDTSFLLHQVLIITQ